MNYKLGFNYLKFDGNLADVDFSYEKVPLDKELQEVFLIPIGRFRLKIL